MGTEKEGFIYPHVGIEENSQLHLDLLAHAGPRHLHLADAIRDVLVSWSEAKHGVYSPFGAPGMGGGFYPPAQAFGSGPGNGNAEAESQQQKQKQETKLAQTVSQWDD